MLEIGKLKLKSNCILAPMSGISDLPFRMLNRRFGCELAFTEMLNVRSLSYKSRNTQQMLSTCTKDKPLGVQLLGCEAKYIIKSLEVLSKHKFAILDFNAACPARKVVRRGEGAALLKEPKSLKNILKLLVKASDVPVTVKIRSGWDNDSVNAKEVALSAQDAGVSAVFVHGRTRMHGFAGGVDYAAVRDVKKALHIPVIGSGDILNASLAKRMLDETGCDGLLIARGALGNPWIFKECTDYLLKGELPKGPSTEELVRVMSSHLGDYVSFYGERIGVIKFRKFFNCYTKGLQSIRRIREKISRAKTWKEALAIIRCCRRPKTTSPPLSAEGSCR
ncbi:tRNA dihydrouridine synthase DusB [Candidatus Omnitrophota bacterium]